MTPGEVPDDTEAYVAGLGVVRVGELRAERIPTLAIGIRPATVRMWEEMVTRNLDPLCGATRPAEKA